MDLYFDNRQELEIPDHTENFLKLAIEEVLLYEGQDLNCELSLSLVSNEEIQELNRTYRDIDEPTDVLSFPFTLDDGIDMPIVMLGDIVISFEKAKEQAEEYGHSLERELIFLTVHSSFHLLGYDHIYESDRKLMRKKEKEVMVRLGMAFEDEGD